MDDTISRKAAIDAVQNRHMMLSKEKVLLINDLEKLPPAEPTFDARDTQYDLPIGTDCISRQQAIEAINEIIRMEHSLRPKVYVAKDAIKQLPSAEPQIIRCKDCIYSGTPDEEKWRLCHHDGAQWNEENHFCGYAERREE